MPHTNYLTFSARFALPGISLPAGTYIFDVMSPGSYDVVRVMSRDGAHVYMTAFTKRTLASANVRPASDDAVRRTALEPRTDP